MPHIGVIHATAIAAVNPSCKHQCIYEVLPQFFFVGSCGQLNLPQKLRDKDFTQHFPLEIIGWSLKLSALSPTYGFQEKKEIKIIQHISSFNDLSNIPLFLRALGIPKVQKIWQGPFVNELG